jgi:DNA mismatch repair ATPase MutS
MCGFPLTHLDKHLKILVQKEQRFVALCEEFQTSPISTTKTKTFERRVARIVTPGTLIDESWLDPSDTNYLLAVSVQASNGDSAVGLAWTDVSTGEFFSTNCDFENMEDELARLRPREVVLDQTLQSLPSHPIIAILKNKGFALSYATKPTTLPSPTLEQNHAVPQESEAIDLLTLFLQQHLLEYMPLLDTPAHERSQEVMLIDSHTIRGLEIRETYEGSTKGSLFSVIKRTATNGGARLLTRWLCKYSPELDNDVVNSDF